MVQEKFVNTILEVLSLMPDATASNSKYGVETKQHLEHKKRFFVEKIEKKYQ